MPAACPALSYGGHYSKATTGIEKPTGLKVVKLKESNSGDQTSPCPGQHDEAGWSSSFSALFVRFSWTFFRGVKSTSQQVCMH